MTSEELIEAQRAGYIAGLRAASKGAWTPRKQAEATRKAMDTYPFTRPRVVRSAHGWEYRVVHGHLERKWCRPVPPHYRTPTWQRVHATRETFVQLIDLFDNPTETVALDRNE